MKYNQQTILNNSFVTDIRPFGRICNPFGRICNPTALNISICNAKIKQRQRDYGNNSIY